MKRKIDGKYEINIEYDHSTIPVGNSAVKSIQIINTFNGNVIPEDEPTFIFRAKDKLALKVLRYYLLLCSGEDCTLDQMNSLSNEIVKFKNFAVLNPDKMKQPGSTMPADIELLCKDCNHRKDDSFYHFDAPGTNWGAALHWFRDKRTGLTAKSKTTVLNDPDLQQECKIEEHELVAHKKSGVKSLVAIPKDTGVKS